MIAPSFGLTATERVLPKLALDFTTASLDARVTFTRSGNTATRINASGVLETVNANTPRFDFNPVTLVCKGLLIEESRANILTYSDDFGNAVWVPAGATVSPDAVVSPDGTQNADKIVESATTGEHKLYRAESVTIGAAYTWSVFAKKGERDWVYIDTADGVDIYTYFDLANGVVGAVGAGVTATITPFGNGWYRCTATKTASNSVVHIQYGVTTSDNVFSYAGDGTSGAYVYGAQFELGAFPTSYIPTTTTSLTRNADVATMTGANFSDWYNQSEGAFAVRYFRNGLGIVSGGGAGTPRVISVDNGTSQMQMRLATAATIELTSVTNIYMARNWTANQNNQAVVSYKADNSAFAVNGGSVTTDLSGTVVNTMTFMNLGYYATNSGFLNGHLLNIRYWPQRLTNAEVQAFSK